MNKIILSALCIMTMLVSFDRPKQEAGIGYSSRSGITIMPDRDVYLYDSINFKGDYIRLKPGSYSLNRLNDMGSSIKVAAGVVAMMYEKAGQGSGSGRYADFLEDCPDLSLLGLDNNISYVNIFYVKKDIYNWARGKIVNGQYVPGHWERQRVNGARPNNTPPPVAGILP